MDDAESTPPAAPPATATGGMSAWITGAGGFVGGHLTRGLRRAGWRVATARVRPGRALDGAAPASGDVVYHLSGVAHRHAAAAEHMAANCDLALALYDLACGAEARAFVYVSSSKVLGDASPAVLGVDAPRRPQGGYAASKAAAERRLLAARLCGPVPVAIVRPPLIYGPGVQGNLRPLTWALARGLPLPLGLARGRRSFVSVDNLTSALTAIGATPERSDGIWHVADDEDIDCATLCRRLAHRLGRPARLLPVPAAACAVALRLLPKFRTHAASLVASAFEPLRLDASAFRRAFRWSPPQTLDAGLAELAQWYLGVR